MRRYLIYSTTLLLAFIAGIIFSNFSPKYGVIPNKCNKSASDYAIQREQEKRYGTWSIGIYEGSTFLDLADPADISNPVLTGRDIIDLDAWFVADPFMLFKDDRYFMFFEVLNRETNQGDIGYAESSDLKNWEYKKIILDENFHLSYPYIFTWNNDYYLIPESYRDLSVRLYKAVSFPDQWEYVGNLLTGYSFVDPSIFWYSDKWWLFVSTPESDVLNLYFSDDLLGEWKPHALNPLIKFNKNIARPGGRVIIDDGHLYRLTQDDDPSFGSQVFVFEITRLSEEAYTEKIVSDQPVICKTGKGWNSLGMHHVDLHKIGDKWIAAVDGRNR